MPGIKIDGARQLSLLERRTWGGRRAGAGRPRASRPSGVPHRTRPDHKARHPLHLTLRAQPQIACLRADRIFPAVLAAIAAAGKPTFRILQFSVQTNHIHLAAEASDRVSLSRGMQGLAIRIARAVNRRLGRRGRVWGQRYHAHALTTPREVRNTLVYILFNRRKHGQHAPGLDPCSSARWFDGWKSGAQRIPNQPSPVAAPRSWLAAVGWRRHGLLSPDEHPLLPRPPPPPRPPRSRSSWLDR